MDYLNNKITQYIILFLRFQSFIALVSLPIIVSWGLPISLLSGIGNFLFNPALALFLVLSALIFFTELLYIPNQFLIFLLNKGTDFWLWTLSFGKKSWLIGFYKAPLYILGISSLLAFIIVTHPKTRSLYRSTLFLNISLILCTGFLTYYAPTTGTFTVPYRKKTITLIKEGPSLTLSDNGTFSSVRSPDNFVDYFLIPEMIKETGLLTLEKVTIAQVNTFSLELLLYICKKIEVKTISLPLFKEPLTKPGWKGFFTLKKYASKNNIKIIRYKKEAAL